MELNSTYDIDPVNIACYSVYVPMYCISVKPSLCFVPRLNTFGPVVDLANRELGQVCARLTKSPKDMARGGCCGNAMDTHYLQFRQIRG